MTVLKRFRRFRVATVEPTKNTHILNETPKLCAPLQTKGLLEKGREGILVKVFFQALKSKGYYY